MKQKSKYIMQGDDKSFCPICGCNVVLLCRADGNTKKPWFYICFVCKMAFEVGVGPVRWEIK